MALQNNDHLSTSLPKDGRKKERSVAINIEKTDKNGHNNDSVENSDNSQKREKSTTRFVYIRCEAMRRLHWTRIQSDRNEAITNRKSTKERMNAKPYAKRIDFTIC